MAQKRLFQGHRVVDMSVLARTTDAAEAAAEVMVALNGGMNDVIAAMQEAGFNPDPTRMPSVVLTFEASGVKQ